MKNIGDIMRSVEEAAAKTTQPSFNVGDTIKMKLKVVEGDKTRIHPWEGIVIRKAGQGIGITFTVRKLSFGEGIERTFPVNSPIIDSLQVVSKGKVRRSKLYYLRGQIGKKSKVETTQVQ
jgi:large subunit ribosomal protein L19